MIGEKKGRAGGEGKEVEEEKETRGGNYLKKRDFCLARCKKRSDRPIADGRKRRAAPKDDDDR